MRGSILSRPLRPPSRANDESGDSQFAKDQRLLEGRRARIIEHEESLRRLRLENPSPALKNEILEENKAALELHRQVTQQQEEAKRRYEQSAEAEAQRMNEAANEAAANAKREKLLAAQKMMEENRLAAEAKKRAAAEEAARTHALERQNAQFMNEAYRRRSLR